MKRNLFHRRSGRAGATLVETAIALPVFLMVLLGSIELAVSSIARARIQSEVYKISKDVAREDFSTYTTSMSGTTAGGTACYTSGNLDDLADELTAKINTALANKSISYTTDNKILLEVRSHDYDFDVGNLDKDDPKVAQCDTLPCSTYTLIKYSSAVKLPCGSCLLNKLGMSGLFELNKDYLFPTTIQAPIC